MQNGLVNIINRLPRERFRHAIISLTESTDFINRVEPKVVVRDLHKQAGKDLGLYQRTFRVLRELQPDIIHTRNLAALEMQIPAWLAGVKRRVHSLHGWDVGDLHGASKKNQWLNRLVAPLVHSYVPLSAELASYLRCQVGVAENKIESICNGVDTDHFSPTMTRQRVTQGQLQFDEQSLVIGTVGRLEQVKDQQTLAHSFVHLINQRPELRQRVRLLIVGEGSQRGAIEAILHDGGCLDISWLPGEQHNIAEWLNAMDLFVLPSRAEGISNTILEAMACGLPVLATAVGGNQELVIDGQTGSLVPAMDMAAMAAAMATYIDEPQRLQNHAQAARQLAEASFSLTGMVAKYEQLYESLLAS